MLNWIQQKSGLLLILPFVHLCVCFLYLVVYFYFFGNHLSLFADAGDIFSVSFTEIAPVYYSLLYWITINEFDLESVAKPSEPPSRKQRKWKVGGVILVLYLTATIIAEYNKSGFVQIAMVWTITAIVAGLAYFVFLKQSTKGRRDLFLVLFWILFSIVLAGASHAQQDRFYGYVDLVKDSPTCNGNVIINKFGTQYLVVRPDNSRWLADLNCKLAARVTPPPTHVYPQKWHFNLWPFWPNSAPR